jgi:short-subunit dehydrogenase involved in D-alanine esterification of teichoic acids
LTAGIQKSFNYFDPTSITPDSIAAEITTNLTAPALIVQLIAPHLARLAHSGVKTSLLVTSSSLAYVPLGFYPSYSASKAGIHALILALRQQLSFAPKAIQDKMCVAEIVPPYTDTGLDAEHREATIAMQGGKEKAFPAMPLEEFVEGFFKALEETGPDGALAKEIGVGFGKVTIDTWRESFGKIYEQWGMST